METPWGNTDLDEGPGLSLTGATASSSRWRFTEGEGGGQLGA